MNPRRSIGCRSSPSQRLLVLPIVRPVVQHPSSGTRHRPRHVHGSTCCPPQSVAEWTTRTDRLVQTATWPERYERRNELLGVLLFLFGDLATNVFHVHFAHGLDQLIERGLRKRAGLGEEQHAVTKGHDRWDRLDSE